MYGIPGPCLLIAPDVMDHRRLPILSLKRAPNKRPCELRNGGTVYDPVLWRVPFLSTRIDIRERRKKPHAPATWKPFCLNGSFEGAVGLAERETCACYKQKQSCDRVSSR